ncbi:sensor histidine kinase [Bacteroides sp. 214]|uniref:sensor histidine kinase n=1 Tax=Bacteroides sp. 214 TaxID=2302935 RepID=UPI0013D513B1|nr:HAMP domain-containing sensor histidine kinase [Bacteroides sp. 214]NDW13015.1 sensor histidine kinase [Bacteroides sp. 214]
MRSTIFKITAFCCLLFIPLVAYSQNSSKDELITALSQATDIDTRLEILTNLSDLGGVTYSKMLLDEAIAAGNNEAAKAALTKLIVNKLDVKQEDSLFYYIDLARKQLTPPANEAISTYYEMIYEARKMQGLDSEACQKIIEETTNRLRNYSEPNSFKKMKDIYVIIASTNRAWVFREEVGEEEVVQLRSYAQEMFKIASTIPLKDGGNLFQQQALITLCNTYPQDSPEFAEYTMQQLDVFENYLELPEIRKRPYYSQRSRIRAYGNLSMSQTISQKNRDIFFLRFTELLKQFPSQAPTPPAPYYQAMVGREYYMIKEDYPKALQQIDTLLKYNTYPLLAINQQKGKAELLYKLGEFENAYLEYNKATQLSDSIAKAESEGKYKELQIQHEVNAEKLRNAELEQHNQRIIIIASVIILFLILGWGVYNYRTSRKLQRLNRKIEESETMKSSFVHSMCHEIRTPLNIISGFTTTALLTDMEPEEKQEMAKEVEKQTALLTKILDDMLEVSQLYSSEDLLPTEPTHIYKECKESIDKFTKLYPDRRWVLEAEDTNPIIHINHTYLDQLIDNLLSNAAKFGEAESCITLAYRIEKGWLKVGVTDVGIGIPVDKQKWVFERFNKINEFTQGAGLGLYVCSLIIKRMRGNIFVDKTYKEGARIVFEVPLN